VKINVSRKTIVMSSQVNEMNGMNVPNLQNGSSSESQACSRD